MNSLDTKSINSRKRNSTVLVVPDAAVKYLISTLLALGAALFFALVFIKVPKSVRVSGLVQLRSPVVSVPGAERGVVAEVLVSEGQLVSKGDPLVRIEDMDAFLQRNSNEKLRLEALYNELVDLDEQLDNLLESNAVREEMIRLEIQRYQSLLRTRDSKAAILQEKDRIMTTEFERVNQARDSGYISISQIDAMQLALLAVRNEHVLLEEQKIEYENGVLNKKNELRAMELEHMSNALSIKLKKSEIVLAIREAEERYRYELFSPIDGVIDKVLASTGQTVGLGYSDNSHLITIMPQDNHPVLTLLVPPEVMKRLSVGNSLNLIIESTLGNVAQSVTTRIERISESPLTKADHIDFPVEIDAPAYSVTVSISDAALHNVLTVPGMRLFANIELQSVTLLSWILDKS